MAWSHLVEILCQICPIQTRPEGQLQTADTYETFPPIYVPSATERVDKPLRLPSRPIHIHENVLRARIFAELHRDDPIGPVQV